MLRLDSLRFRYEPYPIGHAAPVFDEATYQELVSSWPRQELFEHKPDLGEKYSLAERNNGAAYHRFLRSTPVWRSLYEHVKSPDFVHDLLRRLADEGVDLGLAEAQVVFAHPLSNASRRVAERVQQLSWRLGSRRHPRLSSRFEFSMMSAAGGHIVPHTDTPKKLVTLVLSLQQPGEWRPEWGGGTTVLRALDPKRSYNQLNHQVEYQACEVLDEYPYRPNQCVVFVKTFNSLHGVDPMTGPREAMRRTITINIEAAS